mmetsp:Transcript_26823/g.56401  ORF Transcript_26823/g.56401 Transcript_26823/m.56401 type:complete len:382 (-) Transcript_26823:302-1447(-)
MTSERKPTSQAPNTTRRKYSPKPSCTRINAVLVAIFAAIVLVLFNHWHLAVHHLYDLQHGHAHNTFTQFPTSQSQLDNSDGKKDPIQREFSHHASSHHDSPFILSPVCGGCFRSKNEMGAQCYDVIERAKNKIPREKPNSNSTLILIDALIEVARNHKGCEICDPGKCGEHHGVREIAQDNQHYYTKYWRFDDSAPRIKTATTLALKSIPPQFRIPPSRFDNIRQYFIEKFATMMDDNLDGMDFLLEYNPGLVVIPQKTKKYLPKEATYLVSLRVTAANHCFPRDVFSDLPKPVWEAVYHTTTNHLGLALLDVNYQMLPGYDIVIEVDTQVGLKRNMTPGDSLSVSEFALVRDISVWDMLQKHLMILFNLRRVAYSIHTLR